MPLRIPALLGRLPLPAAVLLLGAVVGCTSPPGARHDTDRTAAQIVHDAQQQALGRTEPIEVRSPVETLRRRLLLDQTLPVASPASFGTRAVPPIRQFPDPEYLAPGGDPPDPAAAPWFARVTAAGLAAAAPASSPPPAAAGEGRGEGMSAPPSPPAPAPSPSAAPPAPVLLSLVDALQIAARNSRSFQTEKEKIFLAALALDLQRDSFRGAWTSALQSSAVADLTSGEQVASLDHSASLGLTQTFKNGISVALGLGFNLVRLMTQGTGSSLGPTGDASVTIPLLRGAGSFDVTEPLTQAERDTIYAMYTFERFKQTFAVDITRSFFAVLEASDAVANAEANYRGLIASTRRVRRLADSGRLPEIQVGQALQDELRARDRWVSALAARAKRNDDLLLLLGLPPDAAVAPDPAELARLNADAARLRAPAAPPGPTPGPDAPVDIAPPDREHRGALELEERAALGLALGHRLDLRVAIGRVDDAQRKVAVAADTLLPDLTLLGSATLGGQTSINAVAEPGPTLSPSRGLYTGVLTFDPGLDRRLEKRDYRTRLIDLEKAARAAQELEDQVKAQVRDTLRTLLSARESLRIQEQARDLARRRVDSTNLFLQAGRAEVRDLLEAQESLVSAENARTAAAVRYRVAELELQRDLGLLEVGATGLHREFDPTAPRLPAPKESAK
ncbi:MAG: TolC family protein [Planctomycetes bacterium]|nr:TolC family protein [Planctomycetota bacterium]